ncbi:MAG TPA: AmmeMemoRadiSam system protein B [Gemmatimonadaceae bacterium]|nr:AmmeMemoRadiSam system protein B [Gemmatimonadaceae bacterium]
MSDDLRRSAVAGLFYPADADALRAAVAECVAGVPGGQRRCRAGIVPHAALMYSGKCAGAVFARLAIPPTVVLVGPNHAALHRSPGASLWRSGAFETPLGPVPIDGAFAERLERASDLVAHDALAHRDEHALEVELPFLRVLAPDSAIVPLLLAWDRWAPCASLARALAQVVKDTPHDVLLVASSDLTHYESAERARAKDVLALAEIERADGRALLDACHRHDITMCGRAAAAVVVEAARQLGARAAEVVDYRHSGAVNGDDRRVVSYAGVLIP